MNMKLWAELMMGAKTAPITLRTTPQMKAQVQSLADKQHLSMTGLIEKLIMEELERNE